MTPDASTGAADHTPAAPTVSAEVGFVRCGAELVALAESFYRRMVGLEIVLVGASCVGALALLPLRDSAPQGDVGSPAFLAAAALLVVCFVAVGQPNRVYLMLRRGRRLEYAIVAVATAFIALVPPLQSELWLPACALLSALAAFVSLRRALAYCVLALSANLAAHAVAGDLGTTPAVAILGLWVGIPFWSATMCVLTDRLVSHILRLNAIKATREPSAVRVAAWSDPPDVADSGPIKGNAERELDGAASSEHSDAAIPAIERWNARELEVVALLADGLLHAEIAACLSLSVRQVDRRIAAARARVGAANTSALVALAVSEGLVPPPTASSP